MPFKYEVPLLSFKQEKMDYQHTERRKKTDKAKEKYEKNGKYSQKAIRAMEELRAKGKGTKENLKSGTHSK